MRKKSGITSIKLKGILVRGIMPVLLGVILTMAGMSGNLWKNERVESDVYADATLNNPRIVSDSSMEAGQKVTWDCVWFGSYPQTEIVDKKETCGTCGKAWGKTTDYEVDISLYNQLKSATGWNNQGDLTLDGKKYRRIKKSDVTHEESSVGSYNWKDSDSYHYFRYDKIKWRVLKVSGTRALLLADQALDDQRYNEQHTSITWARSTMRSWLNGYGTSKNDAGTDFTGRNFIDSAFSSAEQGAIDSTTLDNQTTGPYSDNYGGNNTTDRVFLLSSYDLYSTDTSASYGFYKEDKDTYDEARRCKSSTYAMAMGTWSSPSNSYSRNCIWKLRSPGNDAEDAAEVDHNGYVNIYGNSVDNDSYSGVRPALYLNLSSSNLWSFAGTVCSDGTVDEEGGNPTGGSNTCGENLTWTLDDEGTLTINGTGAMENYDYSNSSYNPPPWENSRKSIKKVILKSGVTSVGNSAFYSCSNLTSVTFSDSVTSIGVSAFKDCSNLSTIINPQKVTNIGASAFESCSKLNHVSGSRFFDRLKSIGNKAFKGCSNLTNVTFPDSVTSIGISAFEGCGSLKRVDIPKNITSIKNGVFEGCSNLTDVTIPDRVTSIGNGAFNMSGLTSVEIPKSVTSIGDWVFAYCYDLKNVTFMGDAPNIGANAFADVVAFARYPFWNETWTDGKKAQYGGTLRWAPIDLPEYSGKFNYTSSENKASSYNIVYNDTFFIKSNTGFSIDLARTSIAFSMAAFNKLSGNFTSQSWNSLTYGEKS